MKKYFSFIVLIFIALAVVVLLSGCVTKTITYTKETKKDGTVVEKTVTQSDGSLLTEKTFAAAGSVQGVKVETTGSTSTGTVLPNFFSGGGNSVVLSSPREDNRPVFCYSKSISLLGSLTNSKAFGVSFVYKGIQGETAKETAERIKQLKLLANSEANKETPAAADTQDTKTE